MEGKGEKEDIAKMVVKDVQEQAGEMEKEKAKDKWQQRDRKECEFLGKIYEGTVDNDTEVNKQKREKWIFSSKNISV